MCRYRQRRLSASDSSRVLFEVRKTRGMLGGPHRAQLGDGDLVLATGSRAAAPRSRARPGRPRRPAAPPARSSGWPRAGAGSAGTPRRRCPPPAPSTTALPLALAVLAGLDAQQLLLVVPLVEGLGLVEPLVALQPDEPAPGEVGHRLGQLRSCPSRPGPRPGPAWPGGRPGRPRRRCPRRPGSRPRPGRSRTSSSESKRGGPASGRPETGRARRSVGSVIGAPARRPGRRT